MIEDRKVKVGTKLVARHKGKEYRCEVVAGLAHAAACYAKGATRRARSGCASWWNG